MQAELEKRFQFEATHSLPNLPAKHTCNRLDGYSIKVEPT